MSSFFLAPWELETSSGNDQEAGNGMVAAAPQSGYSVHWAQVAVFRLTLSEPWGPDLMAWEDGSTNPQF